MNSRSRDEAIAVIDTVAIFNSIGGSSMLLLTYCIVIVCNINPLRFTLKFLYFSLELDDACLERCQLHDSESAASLLHSMLVSYDAHNNRLIYNSVNYFNHNCCFRVPQYNKLRLYCLSEELMYEFLQRTDNGAMSKQS